MLIIWKETNSYCAIPSGIIDSKGWGCFKGRMY